MAIGAPPTEPSTPPARAAVSPAARRILLIAAGLFVVHLLAGAVLVPWVVRTQVPRLAAARLQREATLAGVRFNPYTLKATLVGLDLKDRDGTPLLTFDTLVVDLSAASLVRRATMLDEFRLVRPRGVFRLLADGSPAIADLLAADSTARTASTGLPRFVVAHAEVRDGEFDFIDESRTPRYQEPFKDLDLALERISTLPREDGTHLLTAQFSTGARVRWTGKEAFQPLRLDGTLVVDSALVPRWSEVVAGTLPFQLTEGRLGLTLPYHVEQDSAGAFVATLDGAEATVRGIAGRPRGGETDWLRLGGLAASGMTVRWPQRTATVQRVSVTTPWLLATRDADGTLNWQTLMARLPATDRGAASEGPPWSVRLDSVVVTGGEVQLEDRTVDPALALAVTAIDLRLADASTDSTAPVGVAASATVGEKAKLALAGRVARAPLAGQLDVKVDGADLRLVQRYLGPAAPVQIASGSASVKGALTLKPGRPRAAFAGSASMSALAVRDSTGDPLLSWSSAQVEGLRYSMTPDLLRIRRIRFDRPFARIAISAQNEINLMQIAARLPVDTTAQSSLPYEVGEMLFTRAEIDFSDQSLILPFRTTIDSATATIRDVASFGGTPGSLELEGLVDRDGLARASGSLHVADPFAATDVRMEFRNLDLSHFTPYSAQFAGYAIKSGRLDLDMHYRVLERQLDADHHIVAKDLALGEKVEGGESPGFLVKVAISLMKDKNGRITLDVPVTGSVDDPQFSYRGIVWKAMKQMLGKVATAPFRFLGKLLGIGGDAPELVDFDPGRSDLIPPEREKMDSLAAELGRKPELVLRIEGRYDSISDAAALREAKLEALLAQRRDSMFTGKKQGDTSSTALGRTLESLYVDLFSQPALDSLRDSLKVVLAADTVKRRKPRGGYEAPVYFTELRERMLGRQEVAPDELVRLGRARAASIVAALATAGLADSSRMEVLEPSPVKKKKEGSPRIASELAMDAK
jgi:hypothetical protein